MKLSLRKLVNGSQQLSNIAYKQGLPCKLSYALAKNIKKIESELQIYNSEREKIIEKYCVKDEDGKLKLNKDNTYDIKEEFIDVCNKEINSLLDIEVDIDIHKIKINDLYNSNCDMSPAELMVIDYMIDEEE